MAGDAEATKRRILDAALAEFAARGEAGARIDRIAAAAAANKQLIYAYFGSKRELFDAAIENQLDQFHESVPFDPARLPDFAVDVYDFFVAHPELARLGEWHALEVGQQEHSIPAIVEARRGRTRAVARAQRNGVVSDAIPAPELLLLVFAIARAYIVTTPETSRGSNARRRKSVRDAVERLVSTSR
jgi:AcrR family transcriptional regulator